MMKDIVLMVVLPIFAALIYNKLRKDRLKLLHSFMPIFSMAGIIYFTAITTAAGRDHLLQVGGMLIIAAILHNTTGYFLGYWGSRIFGLDKNSCRTIAIEVGLQNGGMASGLAGRMGKLATVGLAPAIFSPWMNVSGSVLANFWRKRPAQRWAGWGLSHNW
jgi:BASS family bile acid:Na+ symporter